MKVARIFSNADHRALEVLANQAVQDPHFLELHYSVHSILVIYELPEGAESPAPPAGE
jgi:hypothetical protein